MEMKLGDLVNEEELINKKSEYKKRELELKLLIDDFESKDDHTTTGVNDLLIFGQTAAEAFKLRA